MTKSTALLGQKKWQRFKEDEVFRSNIRRKLDKIRNIRISPSNRIRISLELLNNVGVIGLRKFGFENALIDRLCSLLTQQKDRQNKMNKLTPNEQHADNQNNNKDGEDDSETENDTNFDPNNEDDNMNQKTAEEKDASPSPTTTADTNKESDNRTTQSSEIMDSQESSQSPHLLPAAAGGAVTNEENSSQVENSSELEEEKREALESANDIYGLVTTTTTTTSPTPPQPSESSAAIINNNNEDSVDDFLADDDDDKYFTSSPPPDKCQEEMIPILKEEEEEEQENEGNHFMEEDDRDENIEMMKAEEAEEEEEVDYELEEVVDGKPLGTTNDETEAADPFPSLIRTAADKNQAFPNLAKSSSPSSTMNDSEADVNNWIELESGSYIAATNGGGLGDDSTGGNVYVLDPETFSKDKRYLDDLNELEAGIRSASSLSQIRRVTHRFLNILYQTAHWVDQEKDIELTRALERAEIRRLAAKTKNALPKNSQPIKTTTTTTFVTDRNYLLVEETLEWAETKVDVDNIDIDNNQGDSTCIMIDKNGNEIDFVTISMEDNGYRNRNGPIAPSSMIQFFLRRLMNDRTIHHTKFCENQFQRKDDLIRFPEDDLDRLISVIQRRFGCRSEREKMDCQTSVERGINALKRELRHRMKQL